ncbi:MAG: PHB depolymerase family esterase [Gemmatimonadota bacterium]
MRPRAPLNVLPFLLAAMLVTPAPVFPQAGGTLTASASTERIQARTYHFAEAGMEMPYELYVPTGYDGSQPTPLVVALHGLGSNPTQMIRYQGLTDLAEERGYIVVTPMGYNSRGWYGSRGPGRASERGDAANDPDNLGVLSEQDVMNVLDLVRDELNIDSDRIYLMGHSMGGGGTWHIGIRNPELFAALGPVAPAIYTSPDALEAIRDVPVIVLMGDADELVDVEVTRQWIARMGELGMTHSYIEISGGDHTGIIARTPSNMARIFDFFDQHSRN